ncbi:MAG: DUF1343 domain-containing protein, partial [Lachnospiraceae bacterium]|nr:DUF1343 domain-containing protein [Lachnospiraceae bacterium]
PGESEQPLTLGDERTEEYLPLLEGKRVAVFSNQTGVVGDRIETPSGEYDRTPSALKEYVLANDLVPLGQSPEGEEIQTGEHILDLLVAKGVNVTAAFSPEHGFRGDADAGKSVENSVDEKTGVPIRSLYSGKSHYPSDGDMDSFDTLVVDLQDVGLRYYTYHISLFYLMEACARKDKEIIILDRPNPNGFYVDGPVLQEKFSSGVGKLPLPVVYGMTWGELAGMINGEGWLSTGKDSAKLTVISCLNYSHKDKVPLLLRPSPNLKDMRAVYLYASTCYFENSVVSVGRGTQYPFEIYGSPYLNGVTGFEYSFTPESMSGATDPPFRGETCYGKDLRSRELTDIWEAGIDLSYLIEAYNAVKEKDPQRSFFGKPDGSGIYWVDKLFGTDSVRKMIEDGKSAEEIKASWQDELAEFENLRSKYLLYEQ